MLHRSPEDGYAIHKDELDRICDENTRLITLSNPNNPTGALLSMDELNELISIARKYNAYIICDEVYSHILQDDQVCPSIADLYEKRHLCWFPVKNLFHGRAPPWLDCHPG